MGDGSGAPREAQSEAAHDAERPRPVRAAGAVYAAAPDFDYAVDRFDLVGRALLSSEAERFIIDPADVTGDVLLRLIFADATNEL